MKIFQNGSYREVPDDAFITLDTLKNRARLLGDFLEKKKNEPNVDFDQIVRTIALGTEKILSSMNDIIDSLAQESIRESDRKAHPIASGTIDISRFHTIRLFREAVTEISQIHSGMKNGEALRYVKHYREIQDTIQDIFTKIRDEHESLLSNLQTKTPEFPRKSESLSFIEKSENFMKDTLVRVARMASLSLFAVSLTTSTANQVSEGRRFVSGRINSIIEKPSADVVINTVPLVNKEVAGVEKTMEKPTSTVERSLFLLLQEHPGKITALAKFDERMKELGNRMTHESLFSVHTYQTGDWELWNGEIAKTLLPSVEDITPEEASIVAKALQLHLDIQNPDAKFGVLSKKVLLSVLSEDKRKLVSKSHDMKSSWFELVLKRILPKHFEEKLEELIGTLYKKGVSDCSGILKTAMRDLWVVDPSFDRSSTDIMKKLTTDRRKVSEVRAWDFFYWQSSKNSRAHHIAYVSSVEKDGLWIIDSSTDRMKTAKRFISWEKALKKKEAIVGTPKFLAQNPVSGKAT